MPVERIVAAAGLMMRWQHTDPPSDVDLAKFTASLNVRELHELRRLAHQGRHGALGACLSIRRISLTKEVRVGFFWPHKQEVPWVENR
jgi:hypothetical protein